VYRSIYGMYHNRIMGNTIAAKLDDAAIGRVILTSFHEVLSTNKPLVG